jgi:hypothetical protein
VCTAFFTGFFPRPSPRFLPTACTAGLRFGIFALFLSYIGSLRQTFCTRRVCALFPAKSRSKRKTSIFYDFSCIAFVILVL